MGIGARLSETRSGKLLDRKPLICNSLISFPHARHNTLRMQLSSFQRDTLVRPHTTGVDFREESMTARNLNSVCTAPDLKTLFIFYLNSNVTADERRIIEEHLGNCDECRQDLHFLRQLKQTWLDDDR